MESAAALAAVATTSSASLAATVSTASSPATFASAVPSPAVVASLQQVRELLRSGRERAVHTLVEQLVRQCRTDPLLQLRRDNLCSDARLRPEGAAFASVTAVTAVVSATTST